MGKIKVLPEPTPRTTKYKDLRGADFSVDPSLVDSKRSPVPTNMISDEGGNPQKRLGWRVLHQLEAPVHNIWFGEINGIDKIIAHAGTKLYDITNSTAQVKKTGLVSAKGTGFFMRKNDVGYLWFTDSNNYYYFDGTTCGNVSDIATRPKILISRNPTGGGTVFQASNLLTGKKTVGFLGTDTDTVYYLPYQNLDSIDSVRVRNSAGNYETITSGYSVNLTQGTVTFTAAKKPVVEGQDNVEIDFTKTTTGYADRIAKCTISAIYGYNALNRVFLSGNPSNKPYDWYSEIYDPTFFGDTNYSIVGTADTAVMGYLKVGEYLAIIKEDNSQDTTIFLRDGQMSGSVVTFRTRQSVVGIGAISKSAFCSLGDEPLFLTRLGVYALTSTLLSYERVVKNRSFRIDKRLVNEANLATAVACEWNGYYIIAINNRAYVLDGRHKASTGKGDSEYAYEAYYWENIPAVCFLSIGGELYFGTGDGRICKFNTDVTSPSPIYAYNDGGTFSYTGGVARYESGGTAIVAQWATPNDDDGGVHYYKRLQKKGCLVVLSPFLRSSGKVYFSVDGNPRQFIRENSMDIFDWNNIDFERFSFSTNETPQEIYFNKKVRKYKRLQIIIVNDSINEPFGIHEIIKTYTIGNYSRK